MEKRLRHIGKRIIQTVVIAALAVLVDYLAVVWSNDESIWLGEAVEVVGSIMCSPAVGGFATVICVLVTDFIEYHSFEYSFMCIFEGASMALIGVIYRALVKDEDNFGIREIVIFNFVQVLVNTIVLYLATPPTVIMVFGFIIGDWSKELLVEEMGILGDNTFSAIISIALIGTFLLAICISFRKKLKEYGNASDVVKSVFKSTFINKEYRTRAFEYTFGIFFAIALTMTDGVVSGHVLGEKALAATSIMVPLISLSTFISNIITSGCSNLCAIAKGDGDYERGRKLFSLGLMTTIFLGVIQIPVYFFTENLYFAYFTSSPEIEAFAREYYHFYIFVPPLMGLATFFDEIAASDGDDGLSYAGYLVSFAVNVGMSIALSNIIGMSGLSIATVLSYVAYIIVVSVHFFKKSNTYKFCFHFSFRDLFVFAERSLKSNVKGLCMALASASFTKAILLFWGSSYLIVNTVLCAMLEIYEIINGPSEAAEYLFATYAGEKNSDGLKTLFKEALTVTLIGGMVLSLFLLVAPNTVLLLYGVEESPLRAELIKCIRFSAVGVIAAAVGGFLSDYYGNIGNPMWSCLMMVFRTALFPILFCVTFSLDGGIIFMGKGMLLSQVVAVAIFYGFVFIVKGGDSIPYLLDDPDFEKVKMNSFDYTPAEYERILGWINDNLKEQGIEETKIAEVKELASSLFKITEEKSGKKKVLGECVLRFLGDPEVIIKDNGELFKPDITDDRHIYNVLMSCNSNKICV
ncbi:MATE family efflux transporter [Butyrivibrio sp. FC2001]|uniref:MATE family efflux transporter n=1 Tax=Butyrivibrio sp. FC2001 TaxID=1280671 RepID=UPI000417FD5A|nr:MATE family efflux transporter [Butyrivibrio sp. FC2001]